jgi:hypothetical protein
VKLSFLWCSITKISYTLAMTVHDLRPLVKARLTGKFLHHLGQNNLVLVVSYLVMAKLFGLPQSYSSFILSFCLSFGLFQAYNQWKNKQASIQYTTEQLVNLNINANEAKVLLGNSLPHPEIKEEFTSEQKKLLKRNPDNYAAQLLLIRRFGCEHFSV